MSKKAQNSNYSIVYVFGPTRCKDNYMNNATLNRANGEFVKIGKTDLLGNLTECTEENIRKQVLDRCSQESKTGISDWCDIYDTFVFPQTQGQNIDDIIRNLLCNDVYSLSNSRDEIKLPKGDIKPGKEYVYGVSRNHIKHTVESYCFQLMINAPKERLSDIQTICKYNANIDDEETTEQETKEKTRTRKNREVGLILSPGDIVYLTDSRNKGKEVTDETGVQISAEYIGNKKFKWGDMEPMFASKLAIELISRFEPGVSYESINGNDCWTKEVEHGDNKEKITLSDLYDSITGCNK